MSKVKDLKQGDFFSLTPRKNAHIYSAYILDIVTGPSWQNVINHGRVSDGDIFLMGECGGKYRGQLVLNPETEIYIRTIAQ